VPAFLQHDPQRIHWRARDGATLVIRPIRPDDEAREAAFVGDLSPETSYRRLLSGRKPQPDEIARWTHIDGWHEVAFVGVDEALDRIVGAARYVRESESTEAASLAAVEFAIVLADDWQGRGLGACLLTRLVRHAREADVATIVGVTLHDNGPMIALAKKVGFRVGREPGDATLNRLTLNLATTGGA
jgi:RimJ/RimL family protein N-acetyltransferase